MAHPSGILEWDLPELATAMRLQEADAMLYFTDGRRVSFMLERRLAYEVLDGTLAPSEGAGWDVRDSTGLKWEVRSISRGGIYFCPSYMVGSGRSFNEPGFLSKLDEIEGYVVSDIESFPRIPFWIIPGDLVRSWWTDGRLGTTTKISRANALKLVNAMP
ncbi:MAG: hypothetical protein P1U58_19310 [Verrucomicrobiales bacterium]|nr:hypothetical protein [Verrucomicrobiales bacterium]